MRNFSLIIAVILAVPAIAGCANSVNERAAAEQAVIWQYCDAASTGPEAALIGSKTFVKKVTELNAQMLSDPSVPTQQEADALKSLDSRRSICRQKVVTWTMQYQPGQAPILQTQFYKEDLALGDLMRRASAYGDANRRIYEAYLESTKLGVAEHQSEIEAAQAEQARRLAIMQAFIANMPKTQPLPMPAPLPAPTNCVTTYAAGAAYTNCH